MKCNGEDLQERAQLEADDDRQQAEEAAVSEEDGGGENGEAAPAERNEVEDLKKQLAAKEGK